MCLRFMSGSYVLAHLLAHTLRPERTYARDALRASEKGEVLHYIISYYIMIYYIIAYHISLYHIIAPKGSRHSTIFVDPQ